MVKKRQILAFPSEKLINLMKEIILDEDKSDEAINGYQESNVATTSKASSNETKKTPGKRGRKPKSTNTSLESAKSKQSRVSPKQYKAVKNNDIIPVALNLNVS